MYKEGKSAPSFAWFASFFPLLNSKSCVEETVLQEQF